MTPIQIHCQNCGQTDPLAVAALIVAGIALVVSFAALGVAIGERRRSVIEHEEFMRQLTARAQFALSARVLNGPAADRVQIVYAGTFEITLATRFGVRIEIRLENVGNKAAGATTLTCAACLAQRRARHSSQ